jgi:hypothetical protein
LLARLLVATPTYDHHDVKSMYVVLFGRLRKDISMFLVKLIVPDH